MGMRSIIEPRLWCARSRQLPEHQHRHRLRRSVGQPTLLGDFPNPNFGTSTMKPDPGQRQGIRRNHRLLHPQSRGRDRQGVRATVAADRVGAAAIRRPFLLEGSCFRSSEKIRAIDAASDGTIHLAADRRMGTAQITKGNFSHGLVRMAEPGVNVVISNLNVIRLMIARPMSGQPSGRTAPAPASH